MEIATNTFTRGMVMDMDSPTNDCCTTALNATMATYNGNEGAIQNDMGNVKIDYEKDKYASLPGIPLGSVEYGGVIYYVLENGDNIEIGSFPSPDYSNTEKHKMIWKYQPLHVLKNYLNETIPFSVSKTKLTYSRKNPVSMLAEPSFDGSINLIINDGITSPRLINTGFHVQDNNTCTIIKRYDDNNTNEYNLKEFDLLTSLYRNWSKLSNFEYNGTVDGGELKVGNYVFYAVSCDKDGNESDIICESGVISIFIGEDGNPFSVQGGLENQNSCKGVDLLVNNIDNAYSYIKLFYTRTTAQNNLQAETLAYKVDKLYQVKNGLCKIIFTGVELQYGISLSDLNIQYFNANSVKAQALNQNILFLGNITQDNGEEASEYEYLRNYSLNIFPEVVINSNFDLDSDYKCTGDGINYYKTKDIYYYTGYHLEEYYRFGIVFIRTDGSLTSVFNTLGYVDINEMPENIIWGSEYEERPYNNGKINNAGIVKIPDGNNLTDIIGIRFHMPTMERTYKGYFFVRQKRIPTILAQGFATNVCEESYLPSINVELEDGTKGYLYESFAKGAFRYKDTDYLFPKNSVSKASNTYQLVHNYLSRLFTLTDYTYLYLDTLKSNGPITAAMREVGNPSKALLQGPTFQDYEYQADTTKEYTCLYFALRENNATTFWTSDSNKDAIYVCAILEKVTDLNIISRLNTATWKGYSDSNSGLISYDTMAVSVDNVTTNVATPAILRSNEHSYCTQNNNKSQYFKLILACIFSGRTDNATVDTSESWGFVGCVFDAVTNQEYTTGLSQSINHVVYLKLADYQKQISSSENNLPIYDSVDIYRLYRIFWSKPSSYTWTAGINDLYRNMFNYCRDFENSDNVSEGKLLNDPEIPTFNGKYLYTEDTKDDKIRTVTPIKPIEHNSYAVFCPEYELNQPYYNNIFTGTDFKYKQLTKLKYFTPEYKIRVGDAWITNKDSRRYKYSETKYIDSNLLNGRSIAVKEGISLSQLQVENTSIPADYWKQSTSRYFSTKAGTESEVNFKFVGFPFISHVLSKEEYPENEKYLRGKLGTGFPFNIVRGIYGSYVGTYVQNASNLGNTILNIYSPEIKSNNIVERRMNDSSSYYAISDRLTFDTISPVCYRGDCYIGYYTHRVNRNFQDSTSPYNDTIIDNGSFSTPFSKCFSIETRTFDSSKEDFNIGDLDAIQLGSWVTFPVRSTMNICLRSVDKSYVDERMLCGNDRAFYPLHGIDVSGSYKIPESEAFNSGYNKSGSERYYFNVIQRVYNKVYYKNRIVYSNVLQLSSLTNGNRVFLSEHYRDYTDLYGEIVKLISIASNLLVVCEHGIFLIPVNERALAAEGEGGQVFINTSNVLPENPKIISDTFGSQWLESIVSTPYGVFGVDETNKKIWFTDGSNIKLISDFKIQEFLNEYLLTKLDLEIKKCNIKSHYIKYKNDVIFTLYDIIRDNNGDLLYENLWSLCWNINEECWRTFYSWLPLDSQNIGNNLITYDLFGSENLWKHGHSQRVPSSQYILPTNWYGLQHPFEIEFVVNENPSLHKIFDNLQIISNKAAPESFHYEVVGESYDFAKLKETAYYRLEKLKELYGLTTQSLEEVNPEYDSSNYGRAILFPQYYVRQDTPIIMYDSYKQMQHDSYDYDNLSGTELIRYRKLNEYRLNNHCKAVDVRNKGQLRGNMHYKEDRWDVQINPINYLVTNEKPWITPPIVIANIQENKDRELLIPAEMAYTYKWNVTQRKEVNVKDKFVKIKVRYSGKDLAIILAINTLYRISYS